MVIPLHDDNPTTTRPYVTVGIIIACALVYVWQHLLLSPVGAQQAAYAFGLIPAVLTGRECCRRRSALMPAPATMFTSMFLHGGFWHLAGNMLYLWIFGNNIEDAMGHVRFFIFYVLCGVAAVFAQVLPNPGSIVPMVGASGAISGVLGAYMLLYPRARVLLGLPLGFLIVQLGRFPAIWVLAAWFVMQLVMGSIARGADVPGESEGGIAFGAHIGGFIAGLAARHNFQTPRRTAVAALLRRCYIPRTLRGLESRSRLATWGALLAEPFDSQVPTAEQPGSIRVIARAATNIAAFVGRALKGPVNEPVPVRSFADYTRVFGGLWQPSTLSYAVEQFFENGGRCAVIVRVVNGARPPTLTLPTASRQAHPARRRRRIARIPARLGGLRRHRRARKPTASTWSCSACAPPAPSRSRTRKSSGACPSRRARTASSPMRCSIRAWCACRAACPPSGRRARRRPPPAPSIGYTPSNPDGDDGGPITDYDVIGSAQCGTGIFALQAAPDINLLCIPPLTREHDVGPVHAAGGRALLPRTARACSSSIRRRRGRRAPRRSMACATGRSAAKTRPCSSRASWPSIGCAAASRCSRPAAWPPA